VTNVSLALSYLEKARTRLKVIQLLYDEKDYSDVVREAQELVELALKGMLRAVGVEPPRHHDVGGLLVEQRELFVPEIRDRLADLAAISRSLRKERELAFYGDIDFIPSEQYTEADATEAIRQAREVFAAAAIVIPPATPERRES